jgi:hypothetical protein
MNCTTTLKARNEPVLLVGETGTGKTTAIQRLVTMYGARFHPGFCRVRVSIIGLWLLYGARFPTEIFHSKDAIEFHAFAPLEARRRVTNGIPLGRSLLLPCGWQMAFLLDVHYLLPVGTIHSVQTLKDQTKLGCCQHVRCLRFATEICTRWSAIEFYAFAPLEALACV